MNAFEPAELPADAFDIDATMRKFRCTREEAEAAIEHFRTASIFMNDVYQVNVSKLREPFGAAMGDVIWLSIKRRDKEPIHDWRELQAIKNALIGPEHEGFELYPAESRLVDTANQYHLYVFMDEKIRMPVGFRERMVHGPERAVGTGAKQRAFAA